MKNKKKGNSKMVRKENSKKRVTLNLDTQTLETLSRIAEENAYDTISSAIRIMVKKYEKFELAQKEQK